MNSTVLGVAIILGVGLVLLAVATLLDRRSARRVGSELPGSPPGTPAVHQQSARHPDDEPPVLIVDAHEAVELSPLSQSERAERERELTRGPRHDLPARLADRRLATHSNPEIALLRRPLVLVCSDPGATVAELLPVLEEALSQMAPLVICTPLFDAQLLDTLAINARRSVLRSVPLLADGSTLERLAEVTGATMVTRGDLQAGLAPSHILGRAILVQADFRSATLVS